MAVETLYRRKTCGSCGGSGQTWPDHNPYDQTPQVSHDCMVCHGEGFVYEEAGRFNTGDKP